MTQFKLFYTKVIPKVIIIDQVASAGSVVQDCFHSYPAGLCHQLSQQGTSWADLLSENSFGILHLTTDCQMQSDNPNLVFKQKKKKSDKDEDTGKQFRRNIQKVLLICATQKKLHSVGEQSYQVQMYNIESDLIR